MSNLPTELLAFAKELLAKEPTLVLGVATAVVVSVLHLVGLDPTTANVTSLVAAVLGLLGIRSRVTPA